MKGYAVKMSDLQSKQKLRSKHTIPPNTEGAVDTTKTDKNHTHLYLHDKFLCSINNLPNNDNINVLYLHNNQIRRIENLGHLRNLTSLYLQRNRIKKIENLDSLTRLKKLFLGYNEILVVEGLHNLENLEELHIQKQNIEDGDSLCFDPRSILSISNTLQVLNISGNNIPVLNQIAPLRLLRVLDASYNKLCSSEDVCNTIRNWSYLHEATFTGNTLCKRHRYRENIIAYTQRLELLDDKEISDTTRSFIKKFELERMQRGSKQSINLSDKFPNLPKNYSAPIQKAVSSSILKEDKNRSFSLDSNINDTETYIPWNSLPTSSLNPAIKLQAHIQLQKKRPNVGKRNSVKFSTVPVKTIFP